MFIDLSIKVSKIFTENAISNEKMASFGHLGTHFDIMNKEFPLEFIKLTAIVFDVCNIEERDIDLSDIFLSEVKSNYFVMFYTGFINKKAYGAKEYFLNHPQLSNRLIDALLDKKVAVIGVDCPGIRRGNEHTPIDQYCADKGVFVVENLCNLQKLIDGNLFKKFIVYTFPINFEGMSGLPCRVVAEF